MSDATEKTIYVLDYVGSITGKSELAWESEAEAERFAEAGRRMLVKPGSFITDVKVRPVVLMLMLDNDKAEGEKSSFAEREMA